MLNIATGVKAYKTGKTEWTGYRADSKHCNRFCTAKAGRAANPVSEHNTVIAARVNCRHSFYPYFTGQKKHYAKEELDEWAAQKVTYNEQDLSRYEGEQTLRHIERNICFYKKKAAIDEAAGLDNAKAQAKIGEWQANARDFSKQTGIQRESLRERIGKIR